jgi:DNA mismatch repair protein MutL
MEQIIRVLPDALANQIAAGEVVQRPASVVKELLENSIDALSETSGSKEIKLIVQQSGKSLIQVIDNGKGMSPIDARLCFERHATSKIKATDDLFNIQTLGFRGEAMASIAAVAQVSLQTKRENDELGTEIIIEGNEFKSQSAVPMNSGTSFAVKNLFFNIPARRNFLKNDSIELQHIIDEFIRVALPNPHISFHFYHGDRLLYSLPEATLKKRIIQIMGDKVAENIFHVEENTNLISIHGFVGKPNIAKKKRGDQYLFVNNRFIKDAYLHHAITTAFEGLLPEGAHPSYFLMLSVDPKTIDVNVHPTKTEIKFEHAASLYAILASAVKRGLGQTTVVSQIDFQTSSEFEEYIQAVPQHQPVASPRSSANPDYNPFQNDPSYAYRQQQSTKNWEKLYQVEEISDEDPIQKALFQAPEKGPKEEALAGTHSFFQFHQSYILAQVKSGLLVIDQQAAHERILFESFKSMLHDSGIPRQKCLFPATFEVSKADALLLEAHLNDFIDVGFELEIFGENSFIVQSVPTLLENHDPIQFFQDFLHLFKEKGSHEVSITTQLAKSMAKSGAVKPGTALQQEEMSALFDHLFACETPGFSPFGKPTVVTLPLTEIQNKFQS